MDECRQSLHCFRLIGTPRAEKEYDMGPLSNDVMTMGATVAIDRPAGSWVRWLAFQRKYVCVS